MAWAVSKAKEHPASSPYNPVQNNYKCHKQDECIIHTSSARQLILDGPICTAATKKGSKPSSSTELYFNSQS